LRKLNIDYEIVEWTSLVSRFFLLSQNRTY
jgi:hypothetical protein